MREDTRWRSGIGEKLVDPAWEHPPELAVEEGGGADRSCGESEAADHRPARPVRKRQERCCGGADDEERERLQQVGADEATGRARESRPAAAGGDAQHADLRSFTQPRGQHGVEERPDGARCVDGFEVDLAAERRPPCHRPKRLRQSDDDECRCEERPVRMRRLVQCPSTQLEGDRDEAGDRRSRDRHGERQTPHRVCCRRWPDAGSALERGSSREERAS